MTDDRAGAKTPELTQADRLYQGFPDFSAWGELPPTDIDLWNRFAASLQERRKAATPEALKTAVDVAVRAAALDTGAIEGLYSVDRGFTMTVALQQLAWEQAIEERGAGVRELFEAQLEAYELVLDAVTRRLPVTEAWIRALHERLCAPQRTYRVLTDMGWQEQELPKGEYKTRPNHVRLSDGTFHAYAPVDRVSSEMHRLLEQIRTPEFEAAHPVLQASYVHYSFVVIHPFADGNGRVARALASAFFYRAQSIPLVIFANQRPAYLDALHAADLGDHRPLLAFFQDRGIDTMQLVVESLMTAEVPALERAVSSLSRLSGLPTGEEMDNIALRLLVSILQQLSIYLEQRSQREGLVFRTGRVFDRSQPSPGYRQVRGAEISPKAFSVTVSASRQETPTEISRTVRVHPRAESSHPFAFSIEVTGNPDRLEVRLEDVFPDLSGAAQLRLDQWVQRQTAKLLADLAEEVRKSQG